MVLRVPGGSLPARTQGLVISAACVSQGRECQPQCGCGDYFYEFLHRPVPRLAFARSASGRQSLFAEENIPYGAFLGYFRGNNSSVVGSYPASLSDCDSRLHIAKSMKALNFALTPSLMEDLATPLFFSIRITFQQRNVALFFIETWTDRRILGITVKTIDKGGDLLTKWHRHNAMNPFQKRDHEVTKTKQRSD